MVGVPAPADLLALMPYAVALGVELDSARPAQCVGRLAWAPERCTAGGLLHGGALVSLADSVAAACAFLNLPPGAATSTITLNATWFGGVRAGEVVATARPLHVGRSVVVVQTELVNTGPDLDDRRVAQVQSVQSVVAPRPT